MFKVHELTGLMQEQQWHFSTEGYLISLGDVYFEIPGNTDAKKLILHVHNFRPSPINLNIHYNGNLKDVSLSVGPESIQIDLPIQSTTTIRIISDVWNPNEEIGNDHNEFVSFHLSGISWE